MKDVNKPTLKSLKSELDEFKGEVLDLLRGLQLKQEIQEVKREVPESPIEGVVEVETSKLPSNYQEIFEEYFDPADGFKAELDFEDNITFAIIVPDHISNATEAWKKYYKIDRRVKVLKQGNIEGGIRDWCSLVAKNLKYNKDILRK